MPFPPSVVTATFHYGAPLTFLGEYTSMSVVITPSADLVWAATGQPFVAFAAAVAADDGESGSFVVPVVDQDGFIDSHGDAITMWSYRVQVTYTKSPGNKRIATKTIQPLTGQTNIDLDLVPNISPAALAAASVPAVLSVNGQTGNVTLDAGGAGLTEDPEYPGLYTIGA